MTLITIRETGSSDESPNAAVSFDKHGEYPITITDPFSEKEEKRLEWYFEEHLRFPFLENVRADVARKSVASYGVALFDQVFQDKSAYGHYTQARQEGVDTLRFEIMGSPEFFHHLHWEALKDPELPLPFAVESPMVRSTFQSPTTYAQSQPSPTINLLIVTARPGERRDIGSRTITRPLVESLRRAKLKVRVDIVRPGTYEALTKHLDLVRDKHGAGFYHIVHFDLHGGLLTYDELQKGAEINRFQFQACYGRDDILHYEGRKAFLSFESKEAGKSDLAEAGEVAKLLTNHRIQIAVLNACQSGKQVSDSESSLASRLLEAGVQTVLAMGYSVTVSAAALMMESLYQQLFAEKDLPVAIRRARRELFNQKERKAYFDKRIDLEDWMLPVVYQSGGAMAESLLALREFTTDEEVEFYEHQARRYVAPKPTYGFVGRDLDILKIENRLLSKSNGAPCNLLLIKGMGGSGKTTLLNHLMEWWQTTNFVGEVFYFGYDEKAWTLQQIMDQIAKELFEAEDTSSAVAAAKLASFRAMNLGAQGQKLADLFRCERHLLVLDNLESITGSNLAIMNTLSEVERRALREFLFNLAGGKTFVLLGTRGGEGWLIEGQNAPLRKNDVYDLPGLDPEAASTLAERILEQNVSDPKIREEHRKSTEFQRLLKVLDGYPLPMQVILANLARQSPAEVLDALQAGGAIRDSKIQSRTESIMRCIDYSHSNLSPEAQELLLCLAPFTGVIFEGWIELYSQHLKQQPNLAQLRFDLWPEVLEEAKSWGLLTPDQMPGFLRLQPAFPYFLRTRLNEFEGDMRQAIEIAFRELYDDIGGVLNNLFQSKKPQERQMGQALARQEYENLSTALDLALKNQASILRPYSVLSLYLDSTQDQKRGLELGEKVLAQLEGYPPEVLEESIGFELVGVIDNIASRQLLLKSYAEAEKSYQKALKMHNGLIIFEEKQKAILGAGIYHQLGRVAQEQRKWEQAEKYYKQALEIKIEFNDRYSQASTYHNLGAVAQEQRKWDQAREYLLNALVIFAEFNDEHSLGIALRNLAKLWQASHDETIPEAVAKVLGGTPEDVKKLFEGANAAPEE